MAAHDERDDGGGEDSSGRHDSGADDGDGRACMRGGRPQPIRPHWIVPAASGCGSAAVPPLHTRAHPVPRVLRGG